MAGKKKADIEEDVSESETEYSPEVLEVAELYAQMAEVTANNSLVPTSEDVRAMALTVYIERHRSAGRSGGFSSVPSSAPAPANRSAGAVDDPNEKRACAGPDCGGQTLVARDKGKGPYWYCSVCKGFTNKNSKGEIYFRKSVPPKQ